MTGYSTKADRLIHLFFLPIVGVRAVLAEIVLVHKMVGRGRGAGV